MAKKIISLNIDEKIHSDYLKMCRERGFVLSKQIENYMRERLKKQSK